MITLPTFVSMIEAIQEQIERDNAISDHLNALMPQSTPSAFCTPLVSKLIEVLEAELGSTDDWISWWLFDAPDQGRNESGSTVTDSFGDHVLATPEDLYDWIRFASKAPAVEDAA